MAKKKRSTEDLDAELAALEAELAALEGRAPKPKPAPAPKPEPQPQAEPAAEPPVKGLAASSLRKGFRFAARGKKEAEPAPPPERKPEPPTPVRAPEPMAAPVAAAPAAYDRSLWRQDADGAWVRSVGAPRVVRRVLDEQGNVVREEPAGSDDLDEVPEAKAERGVGKLLGRWRR